MELPDCSGKALPAWRDKMKIFTAVTDPLPTTGCSVCKLIPYLLTQIYVSLFLSCLLNKYLYLPLQIFNWTQFV